MVKLREFTTLPVVILSPANRQPAATLSATTPLPRQQLPPQLLPPPPTHTRLLLPPQLLPPPHCYYRPPSAATALGTVTTSKYRTLPPLGSFLLRTFLSWIHSSKTFFSPGNFPFKKYLQTLPHHHKLFSTNPDRVLSLTSPV